jgi:hypothetical protein
MLPTAERKALVRQLVGILAKAVVEKMLEDAEAAYRQGSVPPTSPSS